MIIVRIIADIADRLFIPETQVILCAVTWHMTCGGQSQDFSTGGGGGGKAIERSDRVGEGVDVPLQR